jgi:predicted O-methyltransferase YrrM
MELGVEYQARAAQKHDITEQMPLLYNAACQQGVKVIELGVRSGNSTAAFLAAAEPWDGEVWSVDISPPQVPAHWHELPFWHVLVADDVTPEAVAFCPADADVLFIDTSHYYDHTLAELRLYVPKVRPGGVVLMHDTKAAATHFGPGWPDVSRALDDFCAEAGLSWHEDAGSPEWSPGLGIIEIPGKGARDA